MDGEDVKALRARMGITQAELALLLDVHPMTVSKWERNCFPVKPFSAALMQSFKTEQTNYSVYLAQIGPIQTLRKLLR